MKRSTLALLALLPITIAGINTAHAQSAPGLTNSVYVTEQMLQAARHEARSLAAASEQRDLSLAAQRAQIGLLQAQALAALRPTMRLQTGGANPMSFSMPTGSGLLPGSSSGGETNFHVNIQVGEGNTSAINTTTVENTQTISNLDDDADSGVED